MDIEKLQEIIMATTQEFRKGKEITTKNRGGVKVINIYAMPHQSEAPNGLEMVDCHFIMVGVDKTKAQTLKEALKQVLAKYPQPDRLASGPSYIEVGAEIGSQDLALMLFALGKVLGFWEIITPETFGCKGEEGNKMAGRGFVMISGYNPNNKVSAN